MHPATLFFQDWITRADTRARAGTLAHLALGGRLMECGDFGDRSSSSFCLLVRSHIQDDYGGPLREATVKEVQRHE
ncbi:hypothetical protein [Ferrimicrobium acidiphilum]|jgi:hypothetical protein|uniref:hypothetical protein n=1 Tax=Ferrimicrobium acidiphilum TaxID=121039 RepID=UPI0023F3A77D|nr:hypothetical protein [Ferrimicrobium acidiphilum]